MVRGEPEVVEQALIRWMEERELFCVQRHQPGRITWEPLGGFHAAFRRSTGGFSGRRGPIMLAKAETVSATVLALETGYTHVALMATAKRAARPSRWPEAPRWPVAAWSPAGCSSRWAPLPCRR